jgi:hypothetical protein
MHVLSTLSTISIDLASAIFILYCMTLLGHRMRAVLLASEWTASVALLWEAYLGMITVAVAVTLFGMAGFFNRFLFFGILAAGPLLTCRDKGVLLAPLRAVRTAVQSVSGERWAILALAIPGVLALVSTALPEIFYDALYYHLGLPHQYLIKGKIEWDPNVVHSAFPAYLDVLLGVCLGIGGPGAAKFFNLLMFFLAWCATGAFVSQVLGELRTALIATVTIATVPGVVVMSTMCGIDPALIGFSAMSALAVARAHDGITMHANSLTGIISLGAATAGFIAGSKYTGLWLIAVLTPALLVNRSRSTTFRHAFVFSAIALMVAAPWYVRNFLITGDPLYPALKGLWGDADALWVVERLQRDVQTIGLAWAAPVELLSRMISTPARLGAGAETGVLIPLGAGALLIGALRHRELRPWALALTLYLPIWMSLTGVMRYLYPVFPLCALGIAWAASVILRHWSQRRLALTLVAILAVAPLWQSVRVLDALYVGTDAAALFSGTLSRDEYLARRLAYYPAAQWLNAHTDKGAHVLYLGETRLLYVDRQVTLASAYDAAHFDRLLAVGAPPIWTVLKSLGVTHILIHGREIDRLRSSYDYLTLTSEAEHQLKAELHRCRIVFRQSGVQLCEIPSPEVS